MNRAEFRAIGLQGRSTSVLLFEPLNRWERFKSRLPEWLRRRFQPRMRATGWQGQPRGGFLSALPWLSHRSVERREVIAKAERMLSGQPTRLRGRTRYKRMLARNRVLA